VRRQVEVDEARPRDLHSRDHVGRLGQGVLDHLGYLPGVHLDLARDSQRQVGGPVAVLFSLGPVQLDAAGIDRRQLAVGNRAVEPFFDERGYLFF
jgi:hypothetical protein